MNAHEYRSLLNAILASLTGLVRAVLGDGFPVDDKQRAEAALMLLTRMQDARRSTYRTSQEYLAAQSADALLWGQPEQYGLGAILDVFQRITEDMGVDESNRVDAHVITDATKRVTRALQRHAEQPARDLVVMTADRIEGGAWQRVLTGPRSCSFCAMLASRGPIYESHSTAERGPGKAMRGGVEIDVYHDGCDCLVIFVPAGLKDWEGRSQWKRLQHMWFQADKDEDDFRATRKVFRSYWESEVRKGKGLKYVADSIAERATQTAAAEVA